MYAVLYSHAIIISAPHTHTHTPHMSATVTPVYPAHTVGLNLLASADETLDTSEFVHLIIW